MNHALQHLAYWLRHLGWPAGLALVLLVLAGGYYNTVTYPRYQRIEALRGEHAMLQGEIARARLALAKPVLTPEQRLDRFYRCFRGPNGATEWLEKIYQAADKQTLKPSKGDFKISPDQGSQLLRYEILLPVSGTYVQLRAFLLNVLEEVPSAALQDVRLKRENIGQDKVDANIRFIVYLRRA
jgi:hypothetical protein